MNTIETSAQSSNIIPALIQAQTSLTSIRKTQVNQATGSTYVSLDQVLDHVVPVLATSDLFLTQGAGIKDGIVEVQTRLFHKSGEWIQNTMASHLPAPQISDHHMLGNGHAVASAVTYMSRIAIMRLLGIPTQDDDGNAASGKDGSQGERPRADRPKQMPAEGIRIPAPAPAPAPATAPEGLRIPVPSTEAPVQTDAGDKTPPVITPPAVVHPTQEVGPFDTDAKEVVIQKVCSYLMSIRNVAGGITDDEITKIRQEVGVPVDRKMSSLTIDFADKIREVGNRAFRISKKAPGSV